MSKHRWLSRWRQLFQQQLLNPWGDRKFLIPLLFQSDNTCLKHTTDCCHHCFKRAFWNRTLLWNCKFRTSLQHAEEWLWSYLIQLHRSKIQAQSQLLMIFIGNILRPLLQNSWEIMNYLARHNTEPCYI